MHSGGENQPSYSTEADNILRQISITNEFIELQKAIEKLNIQTKTNIEHFWSHRLPADDDDDVDDDVKK